MGIQNLYSLLSKFTESEFKYEEYHKMTVGIDFSCIMHQCTCLIADNKIKNRQISEGAVIVTFFYDKIYKNLKKHSITPIIVFDGESKRSKLRDQCLEGYNKYNNKFIKTSSKEDYEKCYKMLTNSFKITDEHKADIIKCLKTAGIEYYTNMQN